MAPQTGENTALSLYQLIGAPLHAIVDAESQAAQATADFIERVGFRRRPEAAEGDFGDLRMVSFSHQRTGPEGTPRTFRVDVPLLSLVPIPAIQVRDAELEFFVKIVETQRPRVRRDAERPPGEGVPDRLKADAIDFKALMGRGQPEPGRRRTLDMQIKVKIKLEQADVPAGLSKLFNLMEQNITQTEQT